MRRIVSKQTDATIPNQLGYLGSMDMYFVEWDHITEHGYEVCPKSNVNDFFAQPRMAGKEKLESRQAEGKPTYTVGPSSVESAPL